METLQNTPENKQKLTKLLGTEFGDLAFTTAKLQGIDLDYKKNKKATLHTVLVKVSFIKRDDFEKNGWDGETTTRYALLNLDHIPSHAHPKGKRNYAEAHGYTTYWDVQRQGWRNMKNITEFLPICTLSTLTSWNSGYFEREDVMTIAKSIHANKPKKDPKTGEKINGRKAWGESQKMAWETTKALITMPD